jgi:hypothetical protein
MLEMIDEEVIEKNITYLGKILLLFYEGIR